MKTPFLILFFSFFILISFAQNITFYADFEGTLSSSEGENPASESELSFTEGWKGSGIIIPRMGVLQYALTNNLDPKEGAMSVWIRPDWDPGEVLHRILVVGNNPRNFELHVDEGGNLAFAVNTWQLGGNPIVLAIANVSHWVKGEWHQLVFNWSSEEISVFVDGNLFTRAAVGFEIPDVTENVFHIGSLFGEEGFDGAMDEFMVYDQPLSRETIKADYDRLFTANAKPGQMIVTDAFSREVTSRTLELVDWEGLIRNPAFKYYLSPPDSVNYPLTVRLTANHGNAYFNIPSTVSQENGPVKMITFPSSEAVDSFYLSFFPDRNFENDDFELTISYLHKDGHPRIQSIPVVVSDEDVEEVLSYDVVVDFSLDTTAFLKQTHVQEIIEEAARDWVYFVDGSQMEEVPANSASVYMGQTSDLYGVQRVFNPIAYRGLYMYVVGTDQDTPCICSTGYSGDDRFQKINGQELPIRTMGGHEINILGNFNKKGYNFFKGADNWTFEQSLPEMQDFYELTKHEIGHIVYGAFTYPLHTQAVEQGYFSSPEISAYYPEGVVRLLESAPEHYEEVIDPISLGQAFGSNLRGKFLPESRDVLTKIDLLIMQAIGYPMRPIRALAPLVADIEPKIRAVVDRPLNEQVTFSGSLPYFNVRVLEGQLPAGLNLDPFTGMITGTPAETGSFPLSIEVEEYDVVGKKVTVSTTLEIVTAFNTEADILVATTKGQVGQALIDNTANTVMISVSDTVELSDVELALTLSPEARISPHPAEVRDYSQPVSFTVTSEDGANVKVWEISVMQTTTPTEDLFSKQSIQLNTFPNPVGDQLRVEILGGNPGQATIELFNQQGRRVYWQDLQLSQQKWDIPTRGFMPGTYYLVLQAESAKVVKKVVVQ